MAALLSKFRITYSDLVVIPDLSRIPKESTRIWFDGLLRHMNHYQDYPQLSGDIVVVYFKLCGTISIPSISVIIG